MNESFPPGPQGGLKCKVVRKQELEMWHITFLQNFGVFHPFLTLDLAHSPVTTLEVRRSTKWESEQVSLLPLPLPGKLKGLTHNFLSDFKFE